MRSDNPLWRTLTAIAPLLLASVPLASAETIIIGHRGMMETAPENTLPAFAACVERGIGIELDVRTSKDGALVLFHDETLGRTTDGPDVPPYKLTLEQLKKLDAGAWFDPRFAGERIPTLEEGLQLIAEKKTGPTILAVNIKHLTPAGERQLVELLKKYELLDEAFCFDQSQACSQRLRAIDPRVRIGQNVHRDQLQTRLNEDFLDVFLLGFVPTPEEVALLRAEGKQVLFNFAGPGEFRRSPSTWDLARKAGVDGMLTDFALQCHQHWHGQDQ